MIAVGVSRLAINQWRIEHLEQNQAEAGPSTDLARMMIQNGENLTMVAPGSVARNSLISLPKLKNKEMDLAAAGWVAREESTPADQWSVSWSERTRGNKQVNSDTKDIFLLYAAKEDVDRQVACAKAWNGQPSRLVPEFMVLDDMYRHYGLGDDNLEGWNIVFVGKEDHFLCISTPAGILMTRPLPADLSDGEDAQEYLDRLATEVDRSIFFARQTEFNPNIERIVVCGDADLAQQLVQRLAEETSVPAEFWDVAGLFQWEGGSLESRYLLPVMAAVISRRKSSSNLLPDKPRILFGSTARRRLVLAGSTAAVAIVPVLVIGGLLTSTIQNGYLKQARMELTQAEVRADEASEIYKAQRVLLSRENHIADFSENENDYAGVLLHLASLTPEEIIFKDLRFKESGEGNLAVFLTGESKADTVEKAQQAYLKFKRALDESHLLDALGEARKLNITNEILGDVEIKKVEFSMEYRVQETPVVVASIEGELSNDR